MEDPRPAQTPERELARPADATAARTRPIDAAEPRAGDAEDARRAAREADDATREMARRGFGSHKGTEAD
ncbi:hypothetical protein [Sphingomonas montana]|uniref:hypothetical protein n=1 Tax=Sphingomonas montana TaxID=1843236 RepID=UPI00096FA026|nr:hypothetical protein [Sphingomonas montana]